MKTNITKSTHRNSTLSQTQTTDSVETKIPTRNVVGMKAAVSVSSPTVSSRGEQLAALIPEITVGIDLADTKHQVCVLNQLGHVEQEFAIPNNSDSIGSLAHRFPNARFVMEVGTHSPWISAQLREMNCEVLVGNARKLKAISEHERKCDELDARTLAKIGRMDTDLLYPINHVTQDALKDRLVISSRETLVDQRKRLVQSVRGSVKALGLRIEGCSPEVFPRRVRVALVAESELFDTLEPILQAIEKMTEGIRKLDRKLSKLSAEKYPITQLLQRIQGVGPITAIAFVLAVEDPSRIDGTRNIGAYFGLVPGRDQSGDCDKQLGISKTGNPYIRKLLVQCAQYILGAHGPDCDLKRFGERRAGKSGEGKRSAKGAKRKAIVAVARKLAVLLLSLWKSGQDYEPFRHGNEVPCASH